MSKTAGVMAMDKDDDIEKKQRAKQNLRLVILLAFLSLSIYVGYILVYYFR